MNIIFHTVAAVSSGVLISSASYRYYSDQKKRNKLIVILAGIVINVLLHGILDILPHSYPLRGNADVLFSLFVIGSIVVFLKRQYITIFVSCFFGGIFPDLIDLGPAIVNKFWNNILPVVKVFPWHWEQYSGSIFDGSNFYLSLMNHMIVIACFVVIVYVNRKFILHSILSR